MSDERKEKKPRGFALLSAEERAEMSRRGGLALPASRRFFSTNRDAAVEAGRKGGVSGTGEVKNHRKPGKRAARSKEKPDA